MSEVIETEVKEPVSAFDSEGNLRLGYQLTKEDYEVLKALSETPHWKFYRKLLLRAKEAYFNSVMSMSDPNQMIKHVGLVAGINFAINQLTLSCDEYDRLVKKAGKAVVK